MLHYRETIVWRKAMDMAKEVYGLMPCLPREETYGMRAQVTRSAVSVAANVAEGWARESDKERGQFLAIAQGSLAETDTYITLCEELEWMPVERTARVRALMTEVGRMLSTLRTRNRAAGPRK